MRRLPVYLLLDTSGSMLGAPISAVKYGLNHLLQSMRQDPQCLETVFLSVITFDTAARQIAPLQDLFSFQLRSPLYAQGGTALGAAFQILADCIEKEIRNTTHNQRGDWKPLVFLLTDGKPSDNWEQGFRHLPVHKIGKIVAAGIGEKADLKILQQITPHVLKIAEPDDLSLMAYFQWISHSLALSSQTIGISQETLPFPAPPPEIEWAEKA